MVNRIVDELTDQGITVLMSTHDVNYAMEWADEIFLFKDGQVLKSGTPEEVFTDKAALKETNLTQPAVLELFNSLCDKGILKKDLKIPKNLKELEGYISAL